jgi:hypothetical protein
MHLFWRYLVDLMQRHAFLILFCHFYFVYIIFKVGAEGQGADSVYNLGVIPILLTVSISKRRSGKKSGVGISTLLEYGIFHSETSVYNIQIGG